MTKLTEYLGTILPPVIRWLKLAKRPYTKVLGKEVPVCFLLRRMVIVVGTNGTNSMMIVLQKGRNGAAFSFVVATMRL